MSRPKKLVSPRILNVEPWGYCEEARTLLTSVGSVEEKEMSRSQLLRELGSYDVLIVRLAHQIDQTVIEAGRRLKVIVSATTGLDHIDVAHAQSCGIEVLSLRGEIDFLRDVRATAEHTWALLLSLQRHIVPASIAASNGIWNRDAFRGSELYGKRLGLVGLGRIGEKVARYGQAFDMHVGAFDPYVEKWAAGVWRAQTLAELIKNSNILSLHVPLNDETRGMINANELLKLPQGAVLINTSRGQLIDEQALIDCLESGRLAGAALDVVVHERDKVRREKSPLLDYARSHDRLLVTPHIGGATHESMAKTEVFMARKLVKFLHKQAGHLTSK